MLNLPILGVLLLREMVGLRDIILMNNTSQATNTKTLPYKQTLI